MKTTIIRLAAGVIVSLAAVSAQADTVTFATTGTIASGIDELGLFGSSGARLDGQAFSLSISVDTAGLLHRPSTWGAGGTLNEMVQDPSLPTPMSGQVTVGGHSYAWTIDDAMLARITLAAAGPGGQDRPDMASVSAYGAANDGLSVSASSELHTSHKGNEPFVGNTDFDQQRSFNTGQSLLLSSSLFTPRWARARATTRAPPPC